MRQSPFRLNLASSGSARAWGSTDPCFHVYGVLCCACRKSGSTGMGEKSDVPCCGWDILPGGMVSSTLLFWRSGAWERFSGDDLSIYHSKVSRVALVLSVRR